MIPIGGPDGRLSIVTRDTPASSHRAPEGPPKASRPRSAGAGRGRGRRGRAPVREAYWYAIPAGGVAWLREKPPVGSFDPFMMRFTDCPLLEVTFT